MDPGSLLRARENVARWPIVRHGPRRGAGNAARPRDCVRAAAGAATSLTLQRLAATAADASTSCIPVAPAGAKEPDPSNRPPLGDTVSDRISLQGAPESGAESITDPPWGYRCSDTILFDGCATCGTDRSAPLRYPGAPIQSGFKGGATEPVQIRWDCLLGDTALLDLCRGLSTLRNREAAALRQDAMSRERFCSPKAKTARRRGARTSNA